jgi:hypothetical protein
LSILAFLSGLAIASAGLRAVADRNSTASGGLLEHLAAHREDYDLIVVGPSFTRLHFIPPVFDARMKEHGYSVRSFGFGIKGLRGGELDYYLGRILDMHMPNLKWIVCDVTLDQARAIDRRNGFKRRVVYWNEPDSAWFAFDAAVRKAHGMGEQVAQAWTQLRHVLMKVASVGEGVTALREGTWYGRRRKVSPRSAFHVSSNAPKNASALGEHYLKKNKRPHLRGVKALARERKRKRKHPRDNEMLRHWRDRIAAQGVEPWFLISPALGYAQFETRVPGAPRLQVLNFNDPITYPELYDPGLRHDRSHFHVGGAQVFTRDMADTFAAALERKPLKHAHGDAR